MKKNERSTALDESHLIGYMQGYSDGRLEIVNQFIKLNILKKDWIKTYNQKMKDLKLDGFIF